MTIQLSTDSSADLTAQMKKDWNIKVIPLFIHLDDKQFKSEDLTTDAFLEKIKHSQSFPTSSAPGPYEYYKIFKDVPKDQAIIHFSVSDGLSSAYKHAEMGRKMLVEKEPDRKIAVINTQSASSGIILLINETIQKIKEGFSFNELTALISEKIKHLRTIFVLQSLDNLIRGGRLDRVRGAVAKTLNIKLLLQASAVGKIEVLEKVRGNKKATQRFIDKIGEFISQTANQTLVMTHCQAKERLDSLITKIKERYHFDKIMSSEIGPVISVHSGEGAIVMAFFSDDKRTNN